LKVTPGWAEPLGMTGAGYKDEMPSVVQPLVSKYWMELKDSKN